MANYQGKTKDEIIKSEKNKLRGLYRKVDKKIQKAVESLIEEAAFMAASLYELRQIIDEKGYTEEYQNGANQRGTKKCSEVELYNTMIKNYTSVVKQLTDLIPKDGSNGGKTESDEFMDFVNDRDD